MDHLTPIFEGVGGTTAYHGGKYYVVDKTRDLSVFDVESKKITKGRQPIINFHNS